MIFSCVKICLFFFSSAEESSVRVQFYTYESHTLSLFLSLSFPQETQESYGNRNQPVGNAGKPNHDEMGLIQQDRPSSLPVSDKSVGQSEHRIQHHISSVKWTFPDASLFIPERRGIWFSFAFSGENTDQKGNLAPLVITLFPTPRWNLRTSCWCSIRYMIKNKSRD